MYPRLTLVIFGDGLLRDQLLKMVQELHINEKVFFPGSIPNASDYFPAMDYFCMTSKSEGLSNSIMEASAAGLPIITTDSGGSDEIVDDGKTGYVINQQDEDTYFSKLKQIIDHPELSKSMGSLGREKMQKKYGIEVMVNKLSAIYLNY
jgi:glycosyltransferase involved in cell wall biosynthesis